MTPTPISTLTSTISTAHLYNPDRQIVSVDVREDQVSVVYREPSNVILTCNPGRPAPDHVWRETWVVIEGRLVLCERLQGTHTPASMNAETITFPLSPLT